MRLYNWIRMLVCKNRTTPCVDTRPDQFKTMYETKADRDLRKVLTDHRAEKEARFVSQYSMGIERLKAMNKTEDRR